MVGRPARVSAQQFLDDYQIEKPASAEIDTVSRELGPELRDSTGRCNVRPWGIEAGATLLQVGRQSLEEMR